MTAATVRCGYVCCFVVAPLSETGRFYPPDQIVPAERHRQELIGGCRGSPCWLVRAAPTIGRDGTDRRRNDDDDDRAPSGPSPGAPGDSTASTALRRPAHRGLGGGVRPRWGPVVRELNTGVARHGDDEQGPAARGCWWHLPPRRRHAPDPVWHRRHALLRAVGRARHAPRRRQGPLRGLGRP